MKDAQQLHYEFIKFGRIRHSLKNKMLAILPDIYKSGIWKKYAGSIVEYCGKYGDIARTTVIKRLRLEENLIGKPFLKAAIEHVGVHKVAMLANIATPETDKSYAEKALDMSKSAVQGLSKETWAIKRSEEKDSENLGLFGGDSVDEKKLPKCNAVPTLKKIELDADASFLFMKLKAKFGKHMSDAKFMKLILEKLDVENAKKVQNRKERPAKSSPRGSSLLLIPSTLLKSVTGDTTRYVPAKQERDLIAMTNGRCSYPNCNNPYAVIHHADRFSESKSHKSIILLCRIHHEFAHNNLIENEKCRADDWKMSVVKNPINISQADMLYRKYRQAIRQ